MADEGADDKGEHEPIKFGPMRDMLKETVPECQTSTEGVKLLIDQMEFLGKQLWIQASREVRKDGRVRIQEGDIQSAYDELREPHDLLKNSADEMKDMSRKMDRLADASPIFAKKYEEADEDVEQ